MKCNIDDIFGYLSWNNAPEVQSMGIEMAKKIKFLSVLIMPIEDKSVWENCAKVLASKSDDELDRYFIKLFEWIKDMNWPGADIIYRRLSLVPSQKIMWAYKYSVSIAEQTHDDIWNLVLSDFISIICLKQARSDLYLSSGGKVDP